MHVVRGRVAAEAKRRPRLEAALHGHRPARARAGGGDHLDDVKVELRIVERRALGEERFNGFVQAGRPEPGRIGRFAQLPGAGAGAPDLESLARISRTRGITWVPYSSMAGRR